MLVGEKIRKLRALKGYTQEFMAKELNMSQNNYSKIELGEVKISIDTLDNIAGVFKIKPEDVLSFDEKYIFNNNSNSYDTSTANFYNGHATLNDTERALYDKLLKEKDEKIALMEALMNELKKK